MSNEEMAMEMWIVENLGVTTATLSRKSAQRWQRMLMRDHQQFYRLALYGFVSRRRQERGDDSFPEGEFSDFCGEFLAKLQLVLSGKGADHSVPLFRHVGGGTMCRLFGTRR